MDQGMATGIVAVGWGGGDAGGRRVTFASWRGAWNVVPVVLLCLGAAVVALGWAPRAVAAIGVFPAAGGFVWQVSADSINAPAWVAAMSPFAHLAAVPTTTPNWPTASVMTGLAAAGVTAGTNAYRHRDLRD